MKCSASRKASASRSSRRYNKRGSRQGRRHRSDQSGADGADQRGVDRVPAAHDRSPRVGDSGKAEGRPGPTRAGDGLLTEHRLDGWWSRDEVARHDVAGCDRNCPRRTRGASDKYALYARRSRRRSRVLFGLAVERNANKNAQSHVNRWRWSEPRTRVSNDGCCGSVALKRIRPIPVDLSSR